MKRFYGDPSKGFWFIEDLIFSPAELKKQQDKFTWKQNTKLKILWPHLDDMPMRYTEK